MAPGAFRPSEVDGHFAARDAAFVPGDRCADGEVVEAVAVKIGDGHCRAEPAPSASSGNRPLGDGRSVDLSGQRVESREAEHEDRARVCRAGAVRQSRGADDEFGAAIAVEIAHGGAVAELLLRGRAVNGRRALGSKVDHRARVENGGAQEQSQRRDDRRVMSLLSHGPGLHGEETWHVNPRGRVCTSPSGSVKRELPLLTRAVAAARVRVWEFRFKERAVGPGSAPAH